MNPDIKFNPIQVYCDIHQIFVQSNTAKHNEMVFFVFKKQVFPIKYIVYNLGLVIHYLRNKVRSFTI